ncbi:type II secretion system F family protein [Corynebacterium diphtheriae]|uniref:type II secretion system F family protein n=1 Tax=Corynebacterium diphtheriae TaxID=1717 RepID=UPI0008FB8B90|nr:type II secretion system F family protein [Corynebacterium diphtheriae]MBN4651533.1 type II secretion system F family protein [Corynebacterium diphtheriae bv. mitis]MBN4653792.1 type II secretion system F family protein [Corynebacterium diphtheriae bv. mitis]MCS6572640.1 type II secretion system F family protein [Corynebacterium diphtheriae]OIS20445.1 hypothetical protein BHF95_02465 [Corynebacterium diphtheriae]UJM22088.1 type II secretion system F family protein [Corynebacterium diphtheri
MSMSFFLCALACVVPSVRWKPIVCNKIVSLAALVLLPIMLVIWEPVMIAAVLITATVIRTVMGIRRNRADRTTQEALSSALGIIAGDLRCGLGTWDALARVAQEPTTHAPLAAACAAAARRARAGGSAADVLADYSHSIAGLQRVARVWKLSETHGISVVPLVEQLHNEIDDRLRHRDRTKAALQGAQATAIVLSLLPLFGLGMGIGLGAPVLAFLLNNAIGQTLLILGTALQCAGLLWSQALIKAVG